MKHPPTSAINQLPGKTGLAIIALLIMLVGATPSSAAQPAANTDLFSATVKVASQSAVDLSRALPKAFGQVLGRLTANPATIDESWARRASGKARNYLNQYRYETRPLAQSNNLAEVDDSQAANTAPANVQLAGQSQSASDGASPGQQPTPEEEIYLISEFNVEAVTLLLEQNGIAFWSSTRPIMVAWLLHDQGRSRQIIDNSAADPGKLIQQTSREFGLDLVLPLMDLQEQRQVTSSHLWLRDTALLANATSRYSTNVFLLGQLHTLDDGRMTANWLLSIGGTEFQWHHQQPLALKAQLRVGFNAISQQLFQLYSHHPGTTRAAGRIRITQISSAQQYQRAWDYLTQLQGVVSVVPLGFANGKAEFTVSHRGDWSELQRLVQLGNTLVPVELPFGSPGSSRVNGSAASTTQPDPMLINNPPIYRLKQ